MSLCIQVSFPTFHSAHRLSAASAVDGSLRLIAACTHPVSLDLLRRALDRIGQLFTLDSNCVEYLRLPGWQHTVLSLCGRSYSRDAAAATAAGRTSSFSRRVGGQDSAPAVADVILNIITLALFGCACERLVHNELAHTLHAIAYYVEAQQVPAESADGAGSLDDVASLSTRLQKALSGTPPRPTRPFSTLALPMAGPGAGPVAAEAHADAEAASLAMDSFELIGDGGVPVKAAASDLPQGTATAEPPAPGSVPTSEASAESSSAPSTLTAGRAEDTVASAAADAAESTVPTRPASPGPVSGPSPATVTVPADPRVWRMFVLEAFLRAALVRLHMHGARGAVSVRFVTVLLAY